jgi:hypothetical protein
VDPLFSETGIPNNACEDDVDPAPDWQNKHSDTELWDKNEKKPLYDASPIDEFEIVDGQLRW